MKTSEQLLVGCSLAPVGWHRVVWAKSCLVLEGGNTISAGRSIGIFRSIDVLVSAENQRNDFAMAAEGSLEAIAENACNENDGYE